MKLPTFKAKPYLHRGVQKWRLYIPARFSSNGKPRALVYLRKADAERDAAQLRQRFASGDLLRFGLLTAEQLRDARQAFELLKNADLSITLTDAVKLALESQSELNRSLLISELFEQYASTVSEERAWSAKYRSTWRQYSSRFVAVFGERKAATITAQELRDYFSANYASASYYNSATAVIAPAFAWAVQQQTLSETPFKFITRRKEAAREGVDVYSVDEARRLLSTASKHGALLPFAVLLFAGVRPDELTKLLWSDVHIEHDGQMLIHVRPSAAKTRDVRLVRVREPLRALMAAGLQKGAQGKLVPSNWQRIAKAVRAEADLQNRPDVARHSFASYSLAAGETMQAVEDDMGHSGNSRMLFKHYRTAVLPSAAADFWSIRLV